MRTHATRGEDVHGEWQAGDFMMYRPVTILRGELRRASVRVRYSANCAAGEEKSKRRYYEYSTLERREAQTHVRKQVNGSQLGRYSGQKSLL